MEPGSSFSSSLLIGMFSISIPKFPMAKLMKTCGRSGRFKCNDNTRSDYFLLSSLTLKESAASSAPDIPPHRPPSLICLWCLPIPEPRRGRVVKKYQHWLHIKLMDSLPTHLAFFCPSGLPSVSFPLPLFNFFNSLFHTLSASLFPNSLSTRHTLVSPLFLSPVPYFSPSLPAFFQHLMLPSFLFVSCLFFSLTSSSVVWLTEKCLICRAFLLDSSWVKMSATPPGATGTWYSTIVEWWSWVFRGTSGMLNI